MLFTGGCDKGSDSDFNGVVVIHVHSDTFMLFGYQFH